jgi:hypothetical protein
MFLHHFIALAALLASVSSQAICATSEGERIGCFFSKEVGENYEFKIETYKPVGYIGFGLGSGMAKAEMFIAWYKSKF